MNNSYYVSIRITKWIKKISISLEYKETKIIIKFFEIAPGVEKYERKILLVFIEKYEKLILPSSKLQTV